MLVATEGEWQWKHKSSNNAIISLNNIIKDRIIELRSTTPTSDPAAEREKEDTGRDLENTTFPENGDEFVRRHTVQTIIKGGKTVIGDGWNRNGGYRNRALLSVVKTAAMFAC